MKHFFCSTIHKELATLVDGQQNQVDIVEDTIQDAKDKVEGGLKHIENARDRLCAVGEDLDFEGIECGNVTTTPRKQQKQRRGNNNNNDDDDEPMSTYERLYPSSLKQEEETCHWSDMSNWDVYKDIKSVKNDILGLGIDMATIGCSIPKKMASCAGIGNDDDSAIFSSFDESFR